LTDRAFTMMVTVNQAWLLLGYTNHAQLKHDPSVRKTAKKQQIIII